MSHCGGVNGARIRHLVCVDTCMMPIEFGVEEEGISLQSYPCIPYTQPVYHDSDDEGGE